MEILTKFTQNTYKMNNQHWFHKIYSKILSGIEKLGLFLNFTLKVKQGSVADDKPTDTSVANSQFIGPAKRRQYCKLGLWVTWKTYQVYRQSLQVLELANEGQEQVCLHCTCCC